MRDYRLRTRSLNELQIYLFLDYVAHRKNVGLVVRERNFVGVVLSGEKIELLA